MEMYKRKPMRPVHRKGRLRRFLDRHGSLLTFFGASIVLGTFVVKDSISDDAKEKADELAAKRNQFVLETALAKTRYQSELAAEIAENADSSIDDTIRFAIHLSELNTRVQYAQEQIAWLRNISDEIPAVKKLRTDFDDDERILNDVKDEIATFQKPMIEDFAAEMSKGARTRPAAGSREEWDADTQGNWGIISLHAQNLETIVWFDASIQVANAIDSAAEDAANSYHHWKVMAFGLYGLGWTIGLLGRLMQIKGLGGGED